MEKQGKKTIDIDENNKDKKDDKKDSKKESKKTRDIKRGEHKSINMDKLKKQNEQMSVILKHIELKKEIKKALKYNKFSDNEIKLIKSIF